jgi:RNA polymerase sigma factor (sigma-70 family)
MCDNVTEKAKDITSRIRSFLMNSDLCVTYTEALIQQIDAEMKLYEGKQDKYSKRKFVELKIDKEKNIQYLEDTIANKQKLVANVEKVIDKYNSRYKKVFVYFFIENKSYREIADAVGYSEDRIKQILQILRRQLVLNYSPNET